MINILIILSIIGIIVPFTWEAMSTAIVVGGTILTGGLVIWGLSKVSQKFRK